MRMVARTRLRDNSNSQEAEGDTVMTKYCHKHVHVEDSMTLGFACRRELCALFDQQLMACSELAKNNAIVEISKALSRMSNQLQIYIRR